MSCCKPSYHVLFLLSLSTIIPASPWFCLCHVSCLAHYRNTRVGNTARKRNFSVKLNGSSRGKNGLPCFSRAITKENAAKNVFRGICAGNFGCGTICSDCGIITLKQEVIADCCCLLLFYHENRKLLQMKTNFRIIMSKKNEGDRSRHGWHRYWLRHGNC